MYHEEINHATEQYPFLIEHTDVKYIPHFHEETELVYVLDGSLGVTLENRSFILKEGEICIFTPGIIHNLYSFEPNRTFVMKLYSVIDLGNIQLENIVVGRENENYEKLREYIGDIIREDREKNAGYELCVNINAQRIFLLILRNMKYKKLEDAAKIQLANKNEFLNSVTAFLEEHYAQELTLEEAARHLSYTKSYFCHYFKHITGVTFWRYYTIFRLEKALQMMKECPKKKLIEISESAGFKNVRSFNQSFKEYHHCTPREYMKRYF
ncbi:MAG: helix-turn-helix transcriptional regulator [Clostridia bacterium]|nr:helix-turn-helix transcriptional regulator [Clostridia bacterium]